MRRSCILVAVLVSSLGLAVGPSPALCQITADEKGVRDALARFKKGIDEGDATLGPKLATGPYAPQFIALYGGLVETYQKYKAPLPIDVGHIKILGDGRAKAETYLNPARNLVVFTLVRENGEWRFSHQEGTLFPIFEFPRTPYDRVPELPQERRGFMMAEQDLAFRSRVFLEIKRDRGEKAAQDFFLDGPGFKVAMDAWLPFLEGAGQFAIFLAVLESNYYGSSPLVTRADEAQAEVTFTPLRDLEVLKIAVFDPKLSPEEFRALYARIMEDRARACGLAIEMSFADTSCTLRIRRK